jgi:hypothetical protein
VPLPSAATRVANALTCPNGRRGLTTWSEWLSQHAAG